MVKYVLWSTIAAQMKKRRKNKMDGHLIYKFLCLVSSLGTANVFM